MTNVSTVSAPGSLMLFGEHAVLHGYPGIVCAINRRMRVTAEATSDDHLSIQSDLGDFSTPLDNLEPHPSFRFVIGAANQRKGLLERGVRITIESEFKHTLGFGSSAAVTSGVLAALGQLRGEALEPDALLLESQAVIRSVQGSGSGADAAASIYGGLIRFQSDPAEALSLTRDPVQLTLLYSGHKTPTPEVIRFVEDRFRSMPGIADSLYALIGSLTDEAADALTHKRWDDVGRLMNVAQGLMDALGVNTPALSERIYALREDPGILGAKISGAGLGDCVIGLGSPTLEHRSLDPVTLETETEGVRVE